MAQHAVELVAMGHQEASAVCGDVDRVPQHLHIAKPVPDEVTRGFIMIAGDINDLNALPGQPEDLLDHIIVRLRPVPSVPELPAVDDVAHQVQGVEFRGPDEVEQEFGLAAPGAEVDVGNEDRPVLVIRRRHRLVSPRAVRCDGARLIACHARDGARRDCQAPKSGPEAAP